MHYARLHKGDFLARGDCVTFVATDTYQGVEENGLKVIVLRLVNLVSPLLVSLLTR